MATRGPLLFPAAGRHTATVIFAHGLGDTGHGWASAVENWRRRQRLDEVKFILPNAPVIPITCNRGFRMPGWYDIVSLDGSVESLRTSEDESGILRSQHYFHGLIQSEVDAGIPAERIILGGFSQGGAMALFSGLTAPVKIGGVVGLSSYLPISGKFSELIKEESVNKDTPIFMGHGDSDYVVRTMLGKVSAENLEKLGFNVTLKIYDGIQHTASVEELDDVEKFMTERLPALSDKDKS